MRTKHLLKTLTLAGIASALVACGGGGGSDETNAPTQDSSPLSKYFGTYSVCDRDHTEATVTFKDEGNEQFSFITTEVTYQNANCTGTVLGTYKWSAPGIATYESTGIATVRGGGLPSSLQIDKFRSSAPAMQNTLTGPGVVGNCVKYSTGRSVCYELNQPAKTLLGGLYKSGTQIYEMVLENGAYEVYGTYNQVN